MAADEAIRLDYRRLDEVLHEAQEPMLGAPAELYSQAAPHADFQDNHPAMTVSRAFDSFAAHPPKDDPEVSAAFKRLELVEARLARIEKRLTEISVLIARNFNATLETPIGVPEVLQPTPSGYDDVAPSATAASTIQPVPRQTRGKRDRDLDDALEAFLNSLGPPPTQTRQ